MTVARRNFSAIAALAAALACAAGMYFGTYSAGDTDPYGYVSQADLIAGGTLRRDVQSTYPVIPDNPAAWAPAGYVLTRDQRAVVPMYPPGLSLVMALLQRLTGTREAAFHVVPLLAALAVLATYLLGVKCADPSSGAMAAVALATTPVFVANTLQPVSDIPATAWWTASLVMMLRGTPFSSLLSGAAASMAILTRPHLVPLAAVLGTYLIAGVWRNGDARGAAWRKLACFVAATLPGCAAVAAVNDHLHGSPMLSGYGALPDLFRLEHVLPNLDRYPRWVLQTSPVVYLAVLTPVAVRSRLGGLKPGIAGLLLGWSLVVCLLTMFYGYFNRDEWGYTRLLLPAFPPLLVLSSAVARFVVRALLPGMRQRAAIAVTLVAALVFSQLRDATRLHVFDLPEIERRYVDVGMFVGAAADPDAVFIAGLHSGSIRYYGNRLTVYYPRLRQGSLDLAVTTLHGQGRDVYIVLEDGERAIFSERFVTSSFARLDWPPAERTSRGVPVSIWNVRDRDRFLAGAPLATGDLHRSATAAVPLSIGR